MKTIESEVKVGLFVALGLGLLMLAILLLGGMDFFTPSNTYTTHFKTVEGLIPGGKVVLGGINVGKVEKMDLDPSKQDIVITFSIPRKYGDYIRKDSKVEMLTQGVLGDKYLSVTTGSADAPALPSGSEVENLPPKNLTEVIGKSDQLIRSLNNIAISLDSILKSFDQQVRVGHFFEHMNSTAKNLSTASSRLNEEIGELQLKRPMKQLNSILEKVNNGTGTLGALVNDPSLFDDAKAFVGGANRNRILRNLVRKTVKDADEAEARQGDKAKK